MENSYQSFYGSSSSPQQPATSIVAGLYEWQDVIAHSRDESNGYMLPNKVPIEVGLFDSSFDAELIGKEIVRCINMAVDGVHVFLLVLSVHGRFSEEEIAAVSSLLTLFGKEVFDYIIVVFTGGDSLEQESKTLEEYLCDSSETLQVD